MAYSAKILKDSLAAHQWHNRVEFGARLTTFEVTFPRIVLAEFNTHRMFSRNSASSRAIPVEKMLQKVKDDPFIPIYWGKNQKGMQAEEELTPDLQAAAEATWLEARDHAVDYASRLLEQGIHKQITNRLLEPWLWHTVIVTSTEWDNWRGLRCSPEAQPEIRRIADMMMELLDSSTPDVVNEGDWHLPLVDDRFDLEVAGFNQTDIVKVCVGRCCRVSYLTHDGKRDPKADIELCDRLLKSGHMSPFEHAARPMTRGVCMDLYGRRGKYIGDEFTPQRNFAGNLRGWVQARKLIDHEDDFTKVSGTTRALNCERTERQDMNMRRSFPTGAVPPPQFAWQIGKTAASILFVKESEGILAEGKLSIDTALRLRAWVDRVKSGEDRSIDQFLTVQEIVARCV